VNEKIKDFFKINRFWLVVLCVLLAWALGGTISSIVWHGEYKAATAIIDAAGGDEFVKLIERHNDTAVGVRDNTGAAKSELQSAIGYAAELEQRIGRAYGYAESSDGEFVKFRSAMEGHGSTIQDAIRFQQNIIDAVGRIEANNSAIKNELRNSP